MSDAKEKLRELKDRLEAVTQKQNLRQMMIDIDAGMIVHRSIPWPMGIENADPDATAERRADEGSDGRYVTWDGAVVHGDDLESVPRQKHRRHIDTTFARDLSTGRIYRTADTR